MNEIKRVNYFEGQHLRVEDFEDEQKYLIDMQRRHNRGLHTWGIGYGLKVVKITGNDREIKINEGLAIDKKGREIVVPEGGKIVDISKFLKHGTETYYITVSYPDKEELVNSAVKNSCATGYTRVREVVEVELTQELITDGFKIPLARITIDNACKIIEDGIDNTISNRFRTGYVKKTGDTMYGPLTIDLSGYEGEAGRNNLHLIASEDNEKQYISTNKDTFILWSKPDEILQEKLANLEVKSIDVNGSLKFSSTAEDTPLMYHRTTSLPPEKPEEESEIDKFKEIDGFRIRYMENFFDPTDPLTGNALIIEKTHDNPDELKGGIAFVNTFVNTDEELVVETALTIGGDGRVGIGIKEPETKLHVDGSVRGNQSGALRIDTGHGYVDIGPQNTSRSDFITDRDVFYFNKGIQVDSESYAVIANFKSKGTRNSTAALCIENSNNVKWYVQSSYNDNFEIADGGAARLWINNETGNLCVTGDMEIGNSTVERRLTIYGFQHLTSTPQDGAVVIRYKALDTPRLSFDSNNIECVGDTLFMNYYSKSKIQVGTTGAAGMKIYGDLEVVGNITATDKSGYVTDCFVNKYVNVLEQGDVIILSGRSANVYYGIDDNIPVPGAGLTSTVNDRRVCGIVSEILVEEEPSFPEGAKKAQAKGKSKRGVKGQGVYDDGVKRLQVFSAKELEKLDRKKVGKGQIGKMVTAGCYAHCKVDADIAPIEVGDLLTTSATKGHAQKVLEPEKAVGAIIGKALGSLKKGKGKIPVLVMLQ